MPAESFFPRHRACACAVTRLSAQAATLQEGANSAERTVQRLAPLLNGPASRLTLAALRDARKCSAVGSRRVCLSVCPSVCVFSILQCVFLFPLFPLFPFSARSGTCVLVMCVFFFPSFLCAER